MKNEEFLQDFINKYPHYKELSSGFHFYNENQMAGTTGGGNPKIKVYTKQWVYPDNIIVEYKGNEYRVYYMLFPYVNSANLFDDRSRIRLIINHVKGFINILEDDCKVI